MPIRNPFTRRPGGAANEIQQQQQQQQQHPEMVVANDDPAHPGFERVDTVGSKASSALSIRSRRSNDNGEYKMSVVNDSGVYLPPSPTEHDAAWPKRYLSRNSTDTRSSVGGGEIEHFSISRESFDSYRRSFDISARQQISAHDAQTRQSLDSARYPRLMPRSSLSEQRRALAEREREQPPTPEERFEDVGLGGDEHQQQQQKASAQQQQQPPKKKSFFSKFGSEPHSDGSNAHPNNAANPSSTTTTNPMVSRFLMPGRRRAQSGSQGSELGPMDRPATAGSSEGIEAQA